MNLFASQVALNCMLAIALFIVCLIYRKYEQLDEQHRDFTDAINHLRFVGFSYAKNGRRLSPSLIRTVERLKLKRRWQMDDEQVQFLDYYEDQVMGTKQQIYVEPIDRASSSGTSIRKRASS